MFEKVYIIDLPQCPESNKTDLGHIVFKIRNESKEEENTPDLINPADPFLEIEFRSKRNEYFESKLLGSFCCNRQGDNIAFSGIPFNKKVHSLSIKSKKYRLKAEIPAAFSVMLGGIITNDYLSKVTNLEHFSMGLGSAGSLLQIFNISLGILSLIESIYQIKRSVENKKKCNLEIQDVCKEINSKNKQLNTILDKLTALKKSSDNKFINDYTDQQANNTSIHGKIKKLKANFLYQRFGSKKLLEELKNDQDDTELLYFREALADENGLNNCDDFKNSKKFKELKTIIDEYALLDNQISLQLQIIQDRFIDKIRNEAKKYLFIVRGALSILTITYGIAFFLGLTAITSALAFAPYVLIGLGIVIAIVHIISFFKKKYTAKEQNKIMKKIIKQTESKKSEIEKDEKTAIEKQVSVAKEVLIANQQGQSASNREGKRANKFRDKTIGDIPKIIVASLNSLIVLKLLPIDAVVPVGILSLIAQGFIIYSEVSFLKRSSTGTNGKPKLEDAIEKLIRELSTEEPINNKKVQSILQLVLQIFINANNLDIPGTTCSLEGIDSYLEQPKNTQDAEDKINIELSCILRELDMYKKISLLTNLLKWTYELGIQDTEIGQKVKEKFDLFEEINLTIDKIYKSKFLTGPAILFFPPSLPKPKFKVQLKATTEQSSKLRLASF